MLQSNSSPLTDQSAQSVQSISQQPLTQSTSQLLLQSLSLSLQPADSSSSTSPHFEPEKLEASPRPPKDEQLQDIAWNDATSDEGLDDVRDIPIDSNQNIDQAMLHVCDILVAKAPQLIVRHSILI